jgi:hypothetical protein
MYTSVIPKYALEFRCQFLDQESCMSTIPKEVHKHDLHARNTTLLYAFICIGRALYILYVTNKNPGTKILTEFLAGSYRTLSGLMRIESTKQPCITLILG